MSYALPFIVMAITIVVWAYTSYRLRDRFPKYYEWCIKVYDMSPKLVFYLVIAFLIWGFIQSTN